MLSRVWRRVVQALHRRARKLTARLDRWALDRPTSDLVARLLYGLVKPSFNREQRAVHAGRRRYEQLRQQPDRSSAILRRNTHRIEKGLISRPRRDVFAEDYIGETVEMLRRCAESGVWPEELAWAHDVLEEYFCAVRRTPRIEQALRAYQDVNFPVASHPDRNPRRAPYRRPDASLLPSYESLLELARRRRSVRWFDGRPVPREMLEAAFEVAALSPSACNRQPFRFHVFDDPKLLPEVARLPPGTHGFEHNFPCIIAVVGQLRHYFLEQDRHVIYTDAALASMGFVLALETLGLSSCCINWPDIEEVEQAADAVLCLDADERPVMFLAVGFPDAAQQVPYSEKRSLLNLIRYNFE